MQNTSAVTFFSLWLGVSICLAGSGDASGAGPANLSGESKSLLAGETIGNYVFGSGGVLAATSPTYVHHATVGQMAIGHAQSTNYVLSSGFWVVSGRLTGARTADVSGIPTAYMLEQNYPNPFNPSTTIRYGVPHKSTVRLTLFSMLGQQIAELVNGEAEAGYHELRFNAAGYASGVYMYRLSAADWVQTRMMVLVR
jgi:hypothetical protein